MRWVLLPPLILIIATSVAWSMPFDQIPLPDFDKRSLLNGMEFLFLPASTQRVDFMLMVANGAAFDPVDKWGATYLTTLLMQQETIRRSGAHIKEDLEKLGGRLDFQVHWDAIFFSGSAPAEHLVDVLNLLAEIVVEPRFTEERFRQLRDQLARRAAEGKTIWRRSQERLQSILFQGNPYEHPVEGTPETLNNLYLTDIKIQYRKLFMPNQAKLALYYQGDREALFQQLSRRWGVWLQNDPAPFTFRHAEQPSGTRILLMEAPVEEGLLHWGSLGVQKNDRDYYVLKVLEHYLTLSLPNWAAQVASPPQIRAAVTLQARRMPGIFQLSLQAPPAALIAYLQRLRGFLEDLQQSRLDGGRFEEAKRLAYLEMTRTLEQPVPRLRLLLETYLYDLGINFITHYGVRLKRLSSQHFLRFLSPRLSWDGAVLVVAGPVDALRAGLEPLGQLSVLN